MKSLLFIAIIFFSLSNADAWGGKGHDAICGTASFLVKEPGLKEYLKNKPQMMGHLCNMPDFYWKSLGGDSASLGNPTHFIDIEVIGLKVSQIPTDFKVLTQEYTGKINAFKKDGTTIKSVPVEFGSSWWRADQFMRKIAGLEKQFAQAEVPKNSKEEQNNELAYNKLAFDMVTWMGLLGHFTADNSQPFHTTADYDGYATGHGGIHAYFEDAVVGEFDGDLEGLILAEAKKLKDKSFLKPKTAIDKMKALSLISNNEIPSILKLDKVTKKSEFKEERGMQLKTAAERKPASEVFKKMKPLIITQMARGALLTADLWDEAYRSAGKPKMGAYKSYKYPFTVDFIAPDYLTLPETKKEK